MITSPELDPVELPGQEPGKDISSLFGPMPRTLGPAQRLSESPLWNRQRRFYDRDATDIWGSGSVPHGITCNPRIANTYARIVLELLRTAGGDPTAVDRLHLVELGGGTGRFAYLLVRQLRELAPGLPFTYVVTDFAADRVATWAAHPSYRPLIEQGWIDFAVLDGDRPGSLELAISGRTISANSLTGPVIGIANYVFDTLRHDCYAVRGGDLQEVRVAVGDVPTTEPFGTVEPTIVWEPTPLGPVPDDVREVLDQYAETLDDTAVLAPVGAMRCLDFLAGLTCGPAFALVADKGHATPLELCSLQAPSVVYHGSAFSLMVNFDFLSRWVRGRGGVAVLPSEPARSLVVGAFAFGAVADPQQLTCSVRDQLLDVGPDNFFAVRTFLGEASAGSLDAMLASLRLSRFDPTLLVELLPALLDVLPGVSEPERAEVERVLRRVWDNYFPIGEPIDMALCLGLLHAAIHRFPAAIGFLERSVTEHPDSAPAAFSMAVAHRGLRDLRTAQVWVERALVLDPAFSEARTLRAVLADDLGLGV
ncbi:MAG TPA: hypothetical protein VIT41_00080 [Microlunatus sp.]